MLLSNTSSSLKSFTCSSKSLSFVENQQPEWMLTYFEAIVAKYIDNTVLMWFGNGQILCLCVEIIPQFRHIDHWCLTSWTDVMTRCQLTMIKVHSWNEWNYYQDRMNLWWVGYLTWTYQLVEACPMQQMPTPRYVTWISRCVYVSQAYRAIWTWYVLHTLWTQ